MERGFCVLSEEGGAGRGGGWMLFERVEKMEGRRVEEGVVVEEEEEDEEEEEEKSEG